LLISTEKKDKEQKTTPRRNTAGTPYLTEKNLTSFDSQLADTTPVKSEILEDILKPVDELGAHDRDKVVRIALHHFNAAFSFMPIVSILDFCEISASWASKGLPHDHSTKDIEEEIKSHHVESKMTALAKTPLRSPIRIHLSSEVLQELVNGITLGIFKRKETRDAAIKALQAVHRRASYDLDANILLSTNALLHILELEAKKGKHRIPAPLSETVKQVLAEERKMQEEKKPTEGKKEETKEEEDEESSSSSDELSKSNSSKENGKMDKKQKKEMKKQAKREKKEKKQHVKHDEKVLHQDPNHDPDFSY